MSKSVKSISSALVLLLIGLCTETRANAQFEGIGKVDQALAVGVAVGVAAVAGLGITYLVRHNRGVIVGCIAESGGKKTLVDSDKKVYLLSDAGPSLPVGDRAKVKGHKSGPSSAPSLQVEKILKDYGHCTP